ncbi:hypothetical protein E2562_031886 [Oryza meyeriana var. granulata]|uniref:Uncharacterized protein n=1 Tax=Oryza meyeriana var. granulata TaxID=110450 RepID=A0A6G1F051_9ORYZ|nr:hypothetical protein E2562_031886 [Oryza meyeriana var. granulata]
MVPHLTQSRLTQPPLLHRLSAPSADPCDPALLTLVSSGRRLLRHTVLLADWTLQPRPSLRSSTPRLFASSAELRHCPRGPARLSTSTSPPHSSAPTLPPSLSAPPPCHTRTAAPVEKLKMGSDDASLSACASTGASLAEIGIGLTSFGLFFSFLGIIFFFDKGLLAMGNYLGSYRGKRSYPKY